METYSGRDNLVFHGIDQPADESQFSCAKAVRTFMVEQLQFNDGDASACNLSVVIGYPRITEMLSQTYYCTLQKLR